MTIKPFMTMVFTVSIVVLLVSIANNTLRMIQAEKRLDEARNKVSELQQEKNQLLFENSKRQSEGYFEKQIRDKLHLVKPGEMVVVVPEALKTNQNMDKWYYLLDREGEVATQSSPIQAWVALFL